MVWQVTDGMRPWLQEHFSFTGGDSLPVPLKLHGNRGLELFRALSGEWPFISHIFLKQCY